MIAVLKVVRLEVFEPFTFSKLGLQHLTAVPHYQKLLLS